MTPSIALVISAALTWFMVIFASSARGKIWTPAGMKWGMGNREAPVEPSPFEARADRAAKNMLENLPLFIAVVVAAMVAQVPTAKLELPLTLFVAARILYAPIYWAGVPYIRTVVYFVAVGAMGWIGLLAATA